MKTTLSVGGDSTLTGALAIVGATTLSDTLNISGNTYLKEHLSVGETAIVRETLSVGGNAQLSGNLVIDGNFTVNGTTTTVNSTTTTVDDPIMTLGGDTNPSTDDNKDRGIEFRYYDGSAKLGFFGYDDSTSKFILVKEGTITNEVVQDGYTKGDLDIGSATLSTTLSVAEPISKSPLVYPS
jgi:hypothetical protein